MSWRLGNLSVLREKSEDAWGWTVVEALLQDLRYAFRILRKAPRFTATTLVTLALAIGANTAVFSLIDGSCFAACRCRIRGVWFS